DYRLHGFVRASRPIALPAGTWWVRVATAEGTEYRLASSRGPLVWHDFAFRCLAADGQLAEHVDGQGYRAAAFVDGAMAACIWLAPAGVALQPDALTFTASDIADGHSQHVVFTPYAGESEPVVCACFGVHRDTLRDALARATVKTIADVGRAMRAGT